MGKYSWSDKADERREQRRPIPVKKQTKIAKRTSEGAKEDRLYSQLRRKYLEENPFCKAGLSGCTLKATEIHHRKGRGIWLLIVKFFLSVCHNCHTKITAMPIEEAVKKGFSVRRID